MAPLTWKNVDAPNFSGAADMYASVGANFGRGFEGFGEALSGLENVRRDRLSAPFIAQLAGITDEATAAKARSEILAKIPTTNMSDALQAAVLGSAGLGLDLQSKRTSMNNAFDANSRLNTDHTRRIEDEDAMGRVGMAFGRNAEANMGFGPGSEMRDALGVSESGNRYGIVNDEGYSGKYQWGPDRLTDYNRATGQNLTMEDFLANPGIQEDAQRWSEQDILKQLGGYVGKQVGGITLTPGALVGAAHLGGVAGARNWIESGGSYDPADSNGTSISAYAAKFADKSVGGSGSMGDVPTGAGWNKTADGQSYESLVDAGGPNNRMTPDDWQRILGFQYGNDRAVMGDLRSDEAYRRDQQMLADQALALSYAQNLGDTELNADSALETVKNDDSLSPQQRLMLESTIKEQGEAMFRTPTADTTRISPDVVKQSNDAQIMAKEMTTTWENEVAGDVGNRVVSTASSRFGDGSSPATIARKLLETQGGEAPTEDSIGRMNNVIENVSASLGVSPAVAGALIAETYDAGGALPFGKWLDGTYGNLQADPEAAKALARAVGFEGDVGGAIRGAEIKRQQIDGMNAQMARAQALMAEVERLRYLGKEDEARKKELQVKQIYGGIMQLKGFDAVARTQENAQADLQKFINGFRGMFGAAGASSPAPAMAAAAPEAGKSSEAMALDSIRQAWGLDKMAAPREISEEELQRYLALPGMVP
jgi:hypothetical protein